MRRVVPEQNRPSGKKPFRWKARETRLLVYLLILLGIAGWKYLPRPWHPALTPETPHYLIYSTATRQQTEETAHALALLYNAFSNRLGTVQQFDTGHPRLKVKLFKDRTEFRWVNPNLGWAEAFYRKPYCRAYFSAGEANPYHWMLHESVHQLNQEVAHLKLEKWVKKVWPNISLRAVWKPTNWRWAELI